ncbi:MAG: hypothetical protein R2942_06645 [Ignavibacteria bacterium]
MPDAYLNETPGNLVFGNTGFLVTTRTLGAPSALNVAGFGLCSRLHQVLAVLK